MKTRTHTPTDTLREQLFMISRTKCQTHCSNTQQHVGEGIRFRYVRPAVSHCTMCTLSKVTHPCSIAMGRLPSGNTPFDLHCHAGAMLGNTTMESVLHFSTKGNIYVICNSTTTAKEDLCPYERVSARDKKAARISAQ